MQSATSLPQRNGMWNSKVSAPGFCVRRVFLAQLYHHTKYLLLYFDHPIKDRNYTCTMKISLDHTVLLHISLEIRGVGV
jgi:hypothetical protein